MIFCTRMGRDFFVPRMCTSDKIGQWQQELFKQSDYYTCRWTVYNVIGNSPVFQVHHVRDKTFTNSIWMNHSSNWMVLNESFKHLNGHEWIVQPTECPWTIFVVTTICNKCTSYWCSTAVLGVLRVRCWENVRFFLNSLNESFKQLNGPEWIIQASEWSWMNRSSNWMPLNESFSLQPAHRNLNIEVEDVEKAE